MSFLMRIVFGGLGLIALTACSSGGGGPVQDVGQTETQTPTVTDPPDDTDPIAPSQQAPGGDAGNEDPLDEFGTDPPEEVETEASTLLETLAASGGTDTPLTGLIVIVDPTTGDRGILVRDGNYTFDTQTLTLDGAGLTLTSDIAGAFLVSSGMTQTDGAGIVGIATTDAQMRTTGDAVFNGGAAGFVITSAAGFDLTNGSSTVTVSFETGSVTAELFDFVSVSQVTENLSDAPIEKIIWRDAQINGTGFAGGTLETRDASDDLVALTGDNTVFSAQGQFFGLDDATLNPAEVGGLIYAEGDEARVFGSFIAD